MGSDVSKLFDVLERKIKLYNNKRKGCQINYELLKKGDAYEVRFVLGKIIMETMNSESSDGQSQNEQVQSHNHQELSSLFRWMTMNTNMIFKRFPLIANVHTSEFIKLILSKAMKSWYPICLLLKNSVVCIISIFSFVLQIYVSYCINL